MQAPMVIALTVVMTACAGEGEVRDEARDDVAAPAREVATPPTAATALGDGDASLTAEEIERGRRDDGWRRYVQADTGVSADRDTARAQPADTTGERWADITVASLNGSEPALPVTGEREGPTVARVQVLLDRTAYSPGIIDGYWGKNTEKAVWWLQQANGLPTTGTVDAQTYERLVQLAGAPDRIARSHTLTQEEVDGPFVQLPEDVYERAALDCLCYESLREKLAEMFHTTTDLLEQLNPDVDLSAVGAGDALNVPAVRTPFVANAPPDTAATDATIAKIVVSGGGSWVHAVDAEGRALYHFPSTLGSEYAPSPTGDYRVTAIAFDPTWHYQPELLTGEPDDREDAILPPGPNNAVGVVWMDLSREHYGIHGTSAPETIGYATSHGCVRLTNWDARFLAERVAEGTPVEFRDS